jgi:shikimate kinase
VLEARPETIYKRTRRHKRPLLELGDPTSRIRQLLAERTPAYRDAASFTVSGDGRVSTEVVEEIVRKLAGWAEGHPELALRRGDERADSELAGGRPEDDR